MDRVVSRLLVYIGSLIAMLTLGVWGLGVILILWLFSKDRSVIVIAVIKVFWVLYVISPVRGYHTLSGEVVQSLGTGGTLLKSNVGKFYWPDSKQYLGCYIRSEGIAYASKLPENPGGFNQSQWLKRYGVASVWRANAVSVIRCYPSFSQRLYPILHQRFLNLKLRFIPEIESLIWGHQSGKHYDWYTIGVVHFLSISGLHIHGLYTGIYKTVGNILCKKKSKQLAFFWVFLYVALIGFPFCAMRALSMLALLFFPLSNLERYLLTVGFLLTWDTLAILDLGAWYSCIAAGVLTCQKEDSDYYLFVALSGVSYAFGLEIQPLSVVANYVLTPYFIYGIFPMILLGLFVPGLFDLCFQWVDLLLSISIDIIQMIKRLSIIPMIFSWDNIISLISLMGLHYWFALSKFWFLVLYLQLPSSILMPGQLSVDVLSVGHGLAVLVSTKHHHLVYDIGSQQIKDVTHQVLLPFLNHKKIIALDAVVISHPDYDHYSGLETLLEERVVRKIWVSTPVSQRRQYLCQAGIRWVWDGVQFEFMHPNQADVWRGNNQSCVLKVTGKRGSVLLTGDIEKPVERQLIQKKMDLKSTVLVAPHHGSQSSCHDDFLKAVSPRWVVVSESKYKKRKNAHKQEWIYPYFNIIL